MEENTQRLDKYLANIGICSRRNVKQLLKEQLLTINGKRIRESGFRLDPQKDDIRLDGKVIQKPKLVYYLLNKPKGIISTTSDEYSRKNVTSLVSSSERIYPVGRLDKDTTGLILLTNDGELTNLLTHPQYHVFKVYHLIVEGKVHTEQLHALRTGVLLNDGITSPAEVKTLQEEEHISSLLMTIHEGRNRQIRRMCETVGISLLELKRVKFGPIILGDVPEGKYRELTRGEIEALKKSNKVERE